MDASTPLPEVAHFVAPSTADRLMQESLPTQYHIMKVVRAHIVDLEGRGVLLEPMSMMQEVDRVARIELRMIAKGRAVSDL